MIGRVLLTGGARSGKSTAAERRLASHPDVRYVATSQSDGEDREWAARVQVHRDRRPTSWTTVETTDLVGQIVSATPDRPILVDCLTTWLARRLDELDTWTDPDETHLPGHRITMDIIEQEINDLTSALAECPGGVVLVTNEVGSGIVPATFPGRAFRDLMGICNSSVASVCDEVILVVAGCQVPIKTLRQD